MTVERLATRDVGRGTMDDRETCCVRKANSVRDLDVYKLAFDTAMKIHDISYGFPKEEKYSFGVVMGSAELLS